jgi:hypothetical protein
MSVFPSSSIGLPNSLNYTLPPSASDSCRSYSVNLSPDGITSVVSAGAVALVAGAVIQPQFNSQVVSFTIPSCNSNSVFIDPTQTTLKFLLIYALSTAGAGVQV